MRSECRETFWLWECYVTAKNSKDERVSPWNMYPSRPLKVGVLYLLVETMAGVNVFHIVTNLEGTDTSWSMSVMSLWGMDPNAFLRSTKVSASGRPFTLPLSRMGFNERMGECIQGPQWFQRGISSVAMGQWSLSSTGSAQDVWLKLYETVCQSLKWGQLGGTLLRFIGFFSFPYLVFHGEKKLLTEYFFCFFHKE